MAVAELVWREDAEKMMEKVPPFVRSMARRAVEEFARKAGSCEITAEHVRAVQEEYFGFIGKRGRGESYGAGHHGPRGAADPADAEMPVEEPLLAAREEPAMSEAEGVTQATESEPPVAASGPVRIAVVRCHTVAEVCPGVACFMAFNRRKVHFKEYGPETEMIGFFTCGGCSGRRVARLVDSLKKFDLDVLHLSSCMIMKEGYPPCPFRAQIKTTILEKGIPVVEGTHH